MLVVLEFVLDVVVEVLVLEVIVKLVVLVVLLVVLEASGPSRNEFSSRQVGENRTLRTSSLAPTSPPPVAS